MAYLNCPECYFRVRSGMAQSLDGEMSCPRCARKGETVAMYSTQMALNPRRRPEGEVRLAAVDAAAAGPAPG